MERRIPCRAIAACLTPQPAPCYNSPEMPTLYQLLQSRLALLRRVPFWAQALALCALFAIAGAAVVGDYGVSTDEQFERRNTQITIDYALGVSEEPPRLHNRYYGVAFRLPVLLVERALGLQDLRGIFIARHLLTHWFFIAGGFACGMLAYRMLGSRWAALFAMLMFLLHPRLYAHSFFNIKDIPFAVTLVIALYFTHRAFRKDTLGAFLLCGIGAGLAINLRVFGLMLPPMILAMRALDLWQAGRAERKHVLASSAIFTAAALATAYIIHPYYWENPLRFIEGVRALSQHPTIIDNLFMGEIYRSDAVPWNFIPAWFAITAPPLTLTLGVLGAAAVCWQAITRPLAALRDREIRFRIMLLVCIALPVTAGIILQANTHNGWRHMYFMWGPFCLLAAVGLHRIAGAGVAQGERGIAARLPGWVHGGRLRMAARRALAYGAAGFGLITTLTAMAALHPYQQVYFNALTDTKTPGALADRYDMDYWHLSFIEAYRHLLARYPGETLHITRNLNKLILSPADGDRIVWHKEPPYDFYIITQVNKRVRGAPTEPVLHTKSIYGSDIFAIVAPMLSWGKLRPDADDFRAVRDAVAATNSPAAQSDNWNIYHADGALYYIGRDCAPARVETRFFLHITPVYSADLPAHRRKHGFDKRNFDFRWRGGYFDGSCITQQPLPDYPIAAINTGQIDEEGGRIWDVEVQPDR